MLRTVFSLCCLALFLNGFSQQFPETKKTPATITKHGISYQDDYRWLENMGMPEVEKWVASQNAVANDHLAMVKKTGNAEFKIKDYNSLSSNPLPAKKGKYYYSRYRRDKTMPAVLYYRKALNDAPLTAMDPYGIYKDRNITLFDYFPSKNSVYIAGMFSLTGSDRQEVRFSEIANMNLLEDILTNVNSNLAWNKDLGVFYKKNTNQAAFAKDSTYQLFYHRIGTPQSNDQLVLDLTHKEGFMSFYTTKNSLVVIETNKQETKRIYYECRLEDEKFNLEKILEYNASELSVIKYSNGRIYYSSPNFEWGDVRSFDVKNREDDTVLIPQLYMKLLDDVTFFDDYIICKYKMPGKYQMIVYDNAGKFIRKFDAPEGTDFDIRFYDSEKKELFVSFYSYTISFQNFRLNLETGEVNSYYNDYITPKVTLFPLDYFVTKTVLYKSRDGKDVPMTIIHKKGMALDGNNPTLLKAYGGFGSVSSPGYDTGLLYFLEKGGVFAFAEIRGGGERGRNWYRDGIGANKMNSFNDFIDAAEYLIAQKYTSPQKLAITGTSYGGLVVGVAITQRPDLFKVAIPKVGVFDMARFDEYTVGRYHFDEFGNPGVAQDYKSILAYSPMNAIKPDVNYPTTLIITSENDDRVPPVHSYKFAAALQNRAAQKNPVYLQTLSDAGHYGKVSNYKDVVNQSAEFYSFLLYHLK